MKALSFILFCVLAIAGYSQTSKLFVAETVGNVKMIVNSKYQETIQSTAYPAVGTMILTEKDSHQALVYSNGVGMHVGANTTVLVKSYIQEAFPAGQDTFVAEPSITRGQSIITSGIVGICTGKLNAGTQLKYSTPNADVNLYSSKTVIKVTPTGTLVYLLEGRVTVKNSNLSKKIDRQPDLLKPKEFAFIDYDGNVTISPMEDKQMEELGEYTLVACRTRTTVLFQMVEDAAGAETPEIQASPVVPSKLDPNIVISPSRLISNQK